MRVSTVAICTLAALTARELTQEANANPSSNLPIKEPETDNFVVPVKTVEINPSDSIAAPEILAQQLESGVKSQDFLKTVMVSEELDDSNISGTKSLAESPLIDREAEALRSKKIISLDTGEDAPPSPRSQAELRKQNTGEVGTGNRYEEADKWTPSASLRRAAALQITPQVAPEWSVSKGEEISPDSTNQLAQLPDNPTINVPSLEEIRRLQSQLGEVEKTAEFGDVYQGSPSLTIVTPTGFGADNNTGFISATYQSRTRFADVSDGGLGFGVGLGDARKSVGVELSYAIASFGSNRDFGSGGFNAKVHRRLAEDLSIAAGWNGFLNIGDDNDFENSVYGVVTKIFRTRDDINQPFSRVAVTAGVGNGQFRTESAVDDDRGGINVFGSVAVRVARPVSLIAEWTGQDLGVGVSIVPFKNIPLVITPALRDITGAGDGTRFVLGTGFSFKF